MKKALLLCVILLPPLTVFGESLPVAPGLAVELSLPGSHWQISREAPDFLISDLAEHASQGMQEKARKAGIMDPREMIQQMLSANEFYIFNPTSKAYLLADFSPLKPGEEGPSSRTVAKSVHFAGEALENEEGFSEVRSTTSKTQVAGAQIAHRLDARFKKYGLKVQFIGIVGFLEPCWFFFYYTDPLKDEKDLAEMEQMLQGLVIRKDDKQLPYPQ